jgi:ATP-dependent Clp protease ATP-binding subunit ClpA
MSEPAPNPPAEQPAAEAPPAAPSFRDLAFKVSDEEFEPLIEKYCRDLTNLARLGKFDPVIGRDNEIDQVVTILLQRGRSNVAVCGPAGSGKTALFTGFAMAVAQDKVPKMLKNARVIELEFPTMAAGTATRGEFEGRLIPFIKGCGERNASKKFPPIVLCIDEMHTMMPTCKATAASGVSDILKPYLTAGDLQVIGATTVDEFRQYVAADPAMDRRFQKVILEEPSVAATITIIKGLRPKYAAHFGITIDEDMCEDLVVVATKYLRKQNNPDKSIVTLDQSCARAVKNGCETLEWRFVAETLGNQTGVVHSAIERPAK